MRTARPKEVRQARAFLYRRGRYVSSKFCKIFADSAKAMKISFGDLYEFAFSPGDEL